MDKIWCRFYYRFRQTTASGLISLNDLCIEARKNCNSNIIWVIHNSKFDSKISLLHPSRMCTPQFKIPSIVTRQLCSSLSVPLSLTCGRGKMILTFSIFGRGNFQTNFLSVATRGRSLTGHFSTMATVRCQKLRISGLY